MLDAIVDIWSKRKRSEVRIGKTKALFCASVRGRVPLGAPHRPLPAAPARVRRGQDWGGVARLPWGWTGAVGWGRVGPARGVTWENATWERRRQGGGISKWIANAQRCRRLKRHTSVARTLPLRPCATSWAAGRAAHRPEAYLMPPSRTFLGENGQER